MTGKTIKIPWLQNWLLTALPKTPLYERLEKEGRLSALVFKARSFLPRSAKSRA